MVQWPNRTKTVRSARGVVLTAIAEQLPNGGWVCRVRRAGDSRVWATAYTPEAYRRAGTVGHALDRAELVLSAAGLLP